MTLNYAKLRNRPPDRVTQQYGRRDVILYALGVGAGQVIAGDARELRFVYEADLQVLPTMAVVLASEPFWMAEPEWGLDWRRIVHGEQSLTLHRALPPEGCVSSETHIAGIYDKGPAGALIHLERRLWDGQGVLLAEVGKTALVRGGGGFGGDPDRRLHDRGASTTAGPPDVVIELGTRPEQALVYRLSGDLNPLHVDPAAATGAGFPRPLLHGLCTYGVAGRGLMRAYCAGDPHRFRRLDARFSSPMYPGETLRIEAWTTGAGEVAYRGIATERGAVVISNGRFGYAA